ncbi:MAG: type II secretion system protein [Oscillospiraceae bacterium]|nr:type II secretion system protein [Oscillospiraceae bacterium]
MENKKMKGFTLVELIVVIAIIGILASILVPSLMGYVKKAKLTGAYASAKSLYNAAMTSCRETDIEKPIPPGYYSDVSQNGTVNDDFNDYMYNYFNKLKGKDWCVCIKDDSPVGAAVRKNSSDPFVGTYPKANNEKKPGVAMSGDHGAAHFGETGQW